MEKEVDELAVEIWAVIDPLGVTKWHTLSEEQREFYRSRVSHLMSLGYRKRPAPENGLRPLDRESIICWFIDITKFTGYPEEAENKFGNLANDICSKFCQPSKVLSLKEIQWLLKDYDITANTSIPLDKAILRLVSGKE